MSVRLSPDEAWGVLERAHTGILTTLRRDGWPISLPVWFVVLDRTICIASPTRTKKMARIAHDDRAAFLVESGARWAELEAVHVTGRVVIVDSPDEQSRIDAAIDAKYASFRTVRAAMPETAQQQYAAPSIAHFRVVPEGRILSWDNRRLELANQA